MLRDLTPDQTMLANAMSAISEEAWHASWMDHLEFDLWECLTTERDTYGRITLNTSKKEELRRLSDQCGGWIIFHETAGETFSPIDDWLCTFESLPSKK